MTTSSNDPEALRAEIEATRANLSRDVNALGDAVTPGNIARRQTDKAKGAAVGLKDKIMGSAESAASSVGDKASGMTSNVSGSASGAAGSVGDTVGGAPQMAKAQTQGNPLAAGLIALGAGWLLGSLLPASQREQQAAGQLKEQAKPLVGEAQQVAKEAAAELKEPAQQAAESVKSTAQDAAQTVKAEGQSAADDVRSSAQSSKENVQDHKQNPSTSI
jgi:hypothetical protein